MMAEDLSKIFAGVNFALYGFDIIKQEKIRSILVEGGGVDVGQYGPDCTHLIVGKILYDDPICNAARSDGKTLVTGLWVEHCINEGMPVDPTSVMYTPLRDLNGIPGAKSLVICLTGYLRHDRDDIMTMVGLMGSRFSKPLVANKVTHLICYKFEGDKYELAKKLKMIKLVNHRWLIDCLRAWKLLPEADYDKSGYELELLEAQAKDSEDEAENTDRMQYNTDIVGKAMNSTDIEKVTISQNEAPLAKRGKKLDSKKTSEKNDNRGSNLEDQLMASADEETVIQDGPVASGNKMELEVSTFTDNAVEEKPISEEKCSDVTKISNDPPMQETTSITAAPKKASKLKTSGVRKETKNTKRSQLAKRDKKEADLGPNSLQGEMENMPVSVGDQSVNPNKQQLQKLTTNSSKKSTKSVNGDRTVVSLPSIPNSSKRSSKSVTGDHSVHNRMLERAWFILSGHRLQRKECQNVIMHLNGRLCRDTHQWSYQATHLIVPDPVRRTEKFFVAVASGRWILKTDYLTDSNEAGKFLPEEPFEWHKNGLSEDGAINLVAPRKWRTLRERTGHGAFYGMRVVIYGDFIAPPRLETLKRAIKSGDGTILATSPPYSGFLKSGVDYAIVSPGMPCGDKWVQEFLRHEVPCILADYLVDFVCKPKYSLDKHVQYNTQAWAKKSFKKMVESMENIADDRDFGFKEEI